MTDMETPEPTDPGAPETLSLETSEATVFLPRSIGVYQIERELGAGAMGTVFKAIHTGLERAVALKVLRPDMLEDPDSVRRFLREARNIARLEHPYIVSVYDAGESDGMHYIAMKLLEGETLQALLARTGPLPYDRVVRIGMQLASALDYAHAREVVHLDIKPANVMVAPGDRVYLTDFSIAQALNPGATRSATISGTPLYMSPEQITGKDVDSRSDLYSLGLLLYEMCVGHPPFQGQFVTVMYAHLHTEVPDIRAAAGEIPEDLAAVIDRCLVKDRNARYQTAGDLLKALQKLAPGAAADPAGTVALDRTDQELRAAIASQAAERAERAGGAEAIRPVAARRPPWLRYGLPAGIVVVLAALAGGVFLARGQGTSTGSVRVASDPPGAQVSLDGAPRGRAPLTLTSVASGAHTVTLSLATYTSQTVPINVSSDGTTNLHPILHSWPPSRLVQVESSGLTTYVKAVGDRLGVGPPLTVVSAARFRSTTIWGVSLLRLRSGVRGVRNIPITAEYILDAPNGIKVASFPGRRTTLSKDGTAWAYASSVRVTGHGQVPPGQWTVHLVVNGQPLQTLAFTVTP